jgi:hypothetical protein
MGTTSFNGKFGKMRKEQDFIVYPIQSGHRYAVISVESGKMILSSNQANYANSMTLQMDMMNGKAEPVLIPSEELETLLAFIRGTASPMAGNNCMSLFCDNSNASLV